MSADASTGILDIFDCSRAQSARWLCIFIVSTGCARDSQTSEPERPWMIRSDETRLSQETCGRPPSLPRCQGSPPRDAIRKLDSTLLDRLGDPVTILGEVSAIGGHCTLEACPRRCCASCESVLVVREPERRFAVVLGRCYGDECLQCCALPIFGQRVRATGFLTHYRDEQELPTSGGWFALRSQDVCIEP